MATVSTLRPARGIIVPARLAVASGVMGLLSFGCLLTYLLVPGFLMDEAGHIPAAGRLLLDADFLAAMLQALLMLPVVRWLAREKARFSRDAFFFGVTGFALVALLRVLPIFSPKVSDILFMAPTALVGVWLLLVNWTVARGRSKGLGILGMVVAVFLFGVGMNFFFNGGAAVFTRGPFAYGNDVPFHIGLAVMGVPAFTLFPVWSILVGVRVLRQEGEL